MAFKTYVLLDSMNSEVPIYQQVAGGQRVKVDKKPIYRPYLQLTVYDKDGVNHQLRYKSNSNYIFQNEQLEKEKIDANAKWSQRDYSDPVFKNGSLTTNKVVLQKYLENYPGCETSTYTSDDVSRKEYKLLDKAAEAKIKNSDVKQRIKAANKIIELELEEAQEMLIRLNGSFFETPDNVEDCQNLLLEFVDDTNEAGLDAVLLDDKDINVDDKVTILVGKLINAGVLSFDAVQGKISKKKGDKWIELRDMADSYTMDERMRLFSDFLNTEDGKPLKTDLENDLKALDGNEAPKKMGRPPKKD